MPFALNEATRFISPTKTPEYLAGGRPVVSTPIIDVVAPIRKGTWSGRDAAPRTISLKRRWRSALGSRYPGGAGVTGGRRLLVDCPGTDLGAHGGADRGKFRDRSKADALAARQGAGSRSVTCSTI